MADAELAAMQKVYDALEGLDESARQRTLNWAADRLDLKLVRSGKRSSDGDGEAAAEVQEFGDIAAIMHAAEPQVGTEFALVVAYWLQVVEGKDGWSGNEVNSLLKNLGHGLSNVTTTLGSLIKRKPALVMQTGKSGRSAQSKKTYKLTTSGIAEVDRMIAVQNSGAPND
ncbi:MAG TPA: hypothetical protein VFL77_08905 [Solirubrobacterales bacterium]|nr:hypothetical protein [Solirubrobacterales bacterium]